MIFRNLRRLAQILAVIWLTLFSWPGKVFGQIPMALYNPTVRKAGAVEKRAVRESKDTGGESRIINYADPVQGASATDLIGRALQSNAELAATRLDVERARARLRQAGLRPNPTVDFEQATGRLTGYSGERATTVGVALPLEVGGQRQRRIELALAELAAAEAEVAERERRLVGEVRAAYVEALAALRELQTTEELNNLDLQTARVVEARVSEGESARLELDLLRVELDRLRARRALVEGKLQAAVFSLKRLIGLAPEESLRLREDLNAPLLAAPPSSLATAVELALQQRPDLQLARLNERAAQAGLRLARAQATPEVTVSTKYSSDRSITDLPEPLVSFPDRARTLSVGVSIELPFFKRNQGVVAEAATAITQMQRRREFIEQVVRSEVASAYARYQAAQAAQQLFEQGVLTRANANLRTLREAYQMGAFRITELIAEQRRLVDSQREYTEVLTERYRALADLQTAIGALAK